MFWPSFALSINTWTPWACKATSVTSGSEENSERSKNLIAFPMPSSVVKSIFINSFTPLNILLLGTTTLPTSAPLIKTNQRYFYQLYEIGKKRKFYFLLWVRLLKKNWNNKKQYSLLWNVKKKKREIGEIFSLFFLCCMNFFFLHTYQKILFHKKSKCNWIFNQILIHSSIFS